MDLGGMYYFYILAKEKNFTKAAKTLRIGQPALSKAIATYEDQLGVILFERTKSGVNLTAQGKMVYEKAEVIFDHVDDLSRRLHKNQEELKGTLFLGASQNICDYLFPQLLPNFMNQFPKIHFNIYNGVSEIIKLDLISRKLDLGIFYNAPKEPELSFDEINDIEFVLVTSSIHKEKFDGLYNPKKFDSFPFIGARAEDYAKPSPSYTHLKNLKIKPTTNFETNGQETQKKMIIQGIGYGLFPKFMIQKEVDQKTLIMIKTPSPLMGTIKLVQRKSRLLSPEASRFKEYVLDQLPKLLNQKS